jgi:hypothetical protein
MTTTNIGIGDHVSIHEDEREFYDDDVAFRVCAVIDARRGALRIAPLSCVGGNVVHDCSSAAWAFPEDLYKH